jgi:hypothetical protein
MILQMHIYTHYTPELKHIIISQNHQEYFFMVSIDKQTNNILFKQINEQ